MVELIEANWPLAALAVLVVLLAAWWLVRRMRKAPERSHRPDVLDEGVGPALRNQALIDAPSAAVAALQTYPAEPEPERVPNVSKPLPAPAPVSQSAPASPPLPSGGDDLSQLKGVGPKLITMLAGLGITRFDQIAGWDEAAIDHIDAQLGAFAGRIRRDSWVEQARFLASGDTGGFEGKFGKL